MSISSSTVSVLNIIIFSPYLFATTKVFTRRKPWLRCTTYRSPYVRGKHETPKQEVVSPVTVYFVPRKVFVELEGRGFNGEIIDSHR